MFEFFYHTQMKNTEKSFFSLEVPYIYITIAPSTFIEHDFWGENWLKMEDSNEYIPFESFP